MDPRHETTHQLADIALKALKALGLPATPRNFELWYAHAEGRAPALSRDIQKALAAGAGGVSVELADQLYESHILRADLSRDVIDVIERFEVEVSKLSIALDATGETAGGAGQKLQTAAQELKKTARDNPAVASIVESIITVTQTLRENNQRLETQLARSSDEVSSLKNRVESIQQEAMRDPLTGVKNRKTFDLSLKAMLADSERSGAPLTLVIADIDHFKQFNDRWGHQTGDHVLRLVAEVMNANVKGRDVLARYGGEEFAILLPETSLENGRMLADRIRLAVEARRLKKRRTNEDLGVVTLSMGVAERATGDTPESLIDRADERLYRAKKHGRNQVVGDDADAATDAA